ncbi:MAG: 3'-5' exonuclease, partial [Deltaproteobacteria bacterium]
QDFPGAKIVRLEQNYRSTKTIIEASSGLIANNRERKPKKLWTENKKGSLIQSIRLEDEYGEARFVAQQILKQMEEKEAFSNFAIFYRTNAQSRVFEEILREYRVPYQIFGGTHFYGRAEIKDMLGYLRLVLNPKDNVSFLRVVNVPARGIGKVTLEKVARLAGKEDCSFFEAAKLFSKQGDRSALKLKEFADRMEVLIDKRQSLTVQEIYHEILDQTRYVEILKDEKTIEALSRIENLEELDSAMGEFIKRHSDPTLELYLEETSLVSDIDTLQETDAVVKMMTFHSAKGLEFPTVFMVGMEEGLFPYHRTGLDLFELEEERRLCYVGMTRARKNLFL